MTVSTQNTNSTVPGCRMRVSRRRNTNTTQSWRFVPDAILPGHWRAHWWVPAGTPTEHQSRPHTRAHGIGSRNRHERARNRHEVTNMDLVIHAHGSGACLVTQQMTRLPMEDLFSDDYIMGDSMSDLQLWSQLAAKCQNTDLTIIGMPTSPRNRDIANEELSTMTEYLTKWNDMCAVETELYDTRHPEHCAHSWTRESLESSKSMAKMMFAMLTLSSESADPLFTTQMVLCHQESQREPHQCQL